jgi:S-adenosylmethionine hydrolase
MALMAGSEACSSSSATRPGVMPCAAKYSSGLLEIAVNGGSAAQQLGLKKGDRIMLESDAEADFNPSV